MDVAVNTIWSVLARGRPVSESAFSRLVSVPAYNPMTGDRDPVLSILVPFSDELLRSFHVEEITGVLMRSVFRDRALGQDPVNTYEKAVLQWPAPGVVFSNVPADLQTHCNPDYAAIQQLGTGILQFPAVVNPAGTFQSKYGTASFSITNGLSTLIPVLPGLSFQLFGAWPALPFAIQISVVLPVVVDWTAMMTRLQAVKVQWVDAELKTTWIEDPMWTNRLAAMTLDTVLRCRR